MTSPTRSAAPCAIPGTPLADASAGIDACVHCGFCLQACPTYLSLEDENDSPRGRIVLMHALVEGTLSVDDPAARAVVLILEAQIRRTGLQAEAAVHARIDARARVGERRAGDRAERGASSRRRHAAGPRMPGFNTRSGSNVR